MESAASSEVDSNAGHPQRQKILGVMCLVLVLVVVSVSSMNVAIPSIMQDLEPTSAEALWIVDSYALVFAGLLLPAGAIGDKYGRKRALIVGLAIFGIGAFAAFFASSATALIAIRGCMGVGAAFAMPATLSIITVVFPKEERAKAIAIWAGLAGAGGAIGVLSSGLILRWFEWSAVFLVNVPIAVVALGLILKFVPWTRDEQTDPLDPGGALLSIAGFFALLYSIIEGPEKGWTSAEVLVSSIAAVVLLTGFVLFELRVKYPMLDPRVFLIRRFGLASLVVTVAFAAMFGQFFLVAQYFQLVMGQSALESGVRSLPFAVTMVMISPRAPVFSAKFGVRNVLVVGLLVQAGGLFVLSLANVDTSYLLIVVGLVLLAAGMGSIMPALTETIVSSLPADKAGVASAVNDTTREIGGAIGIAVMGSLVATAYRSTVSPFVEPMPEEVAEAASDSIGAALGIAAQQGGEQGQQLVAIAREGFVEGLSNAMMVACVVGVLVAGLIAALYPAESVDADGAAA